MYTGSDWDGTVITVTASVSDNAPSPVAQPDEGTTRDQSGSYSWTLRKRTNPPTTMTRVGGDEEGGLGKESLSFIYKAGPDAPPAYKDQAVYESFGPPIAGFTLSDLKPAWKTANGIQTENDAAALIFNSGDNASFSIDVENKFYDGHTGFGDQDKLFDAFTIPAILSDNGITWSQAQKYEAGPNLLGTYSLVRTRKGMGRTIVKTRQ